MSVLHSYPGVIFYLLQLICALNKINIGKKHTQPFIKQTAVKMLKTIKLKEGWEGVGHPLYGGSSQ